jgi:hypothetical protein
MQHDSLLMEIMAAARETTNLSLQRVLSWMQSRDIKVMALVEHLLGNKRFVERIEPPLQFKDYHKFLIHYLEQCIRSDVRGNEYVLERWEAGYRLATYFWYLMDEPSLPGDARDDGINDLKRLLSRLYKASELRDFVVHSVLEHVLEHPQAARYFQDWRRHPLLRRAYEQAAAWASTVRKEDSMLNIHNRFLGMIGKEEE